MSVDINKFHAEVERKLREAQEKFSVNLSGVRVRYDLRGQPAGEAGIKMGTLYLRFNPVGMERDWDNMYYDTIPHEIAHLVCIVKPSLGGRDHNKAWKRVCQALGGSPRRCHTIDIPHAHGSYRYRASCGTEINFSKQMHRRIQQGSTRRLRKTRGLVTSKDYIGYVTPTGKLQPKDGGPATKLPTKRDKLTEYIKQNYDNKVDALFDSSKIISQARSMGVTSFDAAKRYTKECIQEAFG